VRQHSRSPSWNPYGQIRVRTVVYTLGWPPGDRIAVVVRNRATAQPRNRAIVISPAAGSRHILCADGLIVLPAVARRNHRLREDLRSR